MKWPEKTSPQRQKIIGCQGLMKKKGKTWMIISPKCCYLSGGKTSGLLRQGFAKYLRMVSKSQESSCPSFMSTSNTVMYNAQLKSKSFALCGHTNFLPGPFSLSSVFSSSSMTFLKILINVCNHCHFISTQRSMMRNTGSGKLSTSCLLPYRSAVSMNSYQQNTFEHKLPK